jgi:hypothetical protein
MFARFACGLSRARTVRLAAERGVEIGRHLSEIAANPGRVIVGGGRRPELELALVHPDLLSESSPKSR